MLKSRAVFGPGYSEDFKNIMKACCQELMGRFQSCCGYTQSDELMILLPPISKANTDKHNFSGRIQKFCSPAAATVSARFT